MFFVSYCFLKPGVLLNLVQICLIHGKPVQLNNNTH